MIDECAKSSSCQWYKIEQGKHAHFHDGALILKMVVTYNRKIGRVTIKKDCGKYEEGNKCGNKTVTWGITRLGIIATALDKLTGKGQISENSPSQIDCHHSTWQDKGGKLENPGIIFILICIYN